jgi:hypothetical protein
MPHETIEDSWNDLLARLPVGNVLTPEGLVACRNAFYAGSFSTYLRFEQAAMVGPAAVHTMMDETRAEFAEYHQRMRDKQ